MRKLTNLLNNLKTDNWSAFSIPSKDKNYVHEPGGHDLKTTNYGEQFI